MNFHQIFFGSSTEINGVTSAGSLSSFTFPTSASTSLSLSWAQHQARHLSQNTVVGGNMFSGYDVYTKRYEPIPKPIMVVNQSHGIGSEGFSNISTRKAKPPRKDIIQKNQAPTKKSLEQCTFRHSTQQQQHLTKKLSKLMLDPRPLFAIIF